MLLLIVLVGLLILLFYKRTVYAPPSVWTPPVQPFVPPQQPQQSQPQVGAPQAGAPQAGAPQAGAPQAGAPQAGAPQAQQSAQGSAPITRAATFAPPPAAPSSSAFAAPPDPSTIKPAPLPPPVDLNDVFRRPSA